MSIEVLLEEFTVLYETVEHLCGSLRVTNHCHLLIISQSSELSNVLDESWQIILGYLNEAMVPILAVELGVEVRVLVTVLITPGIWQPDVIASFCRNEGG